MTHVQQTNNESSGRRTSVVRSVETMQVASFPPPKLKTKFKTVHKWLSQICKYDKPNKTIITYKFSLFESPEGITMLCLTGENAYEEGTGYASTRIVFPPLSLQSKLIKAEYKNLTHEQLLDKLALQLKTFADTEDFKTSFLAEGNDIIFTANGQTIWPKNS